jgi:hypothetical protein
MVEASEPKEVARELVGDAGYWLEERETGGDGRKKFAIYSPAGELLGMKWGKSQAEAAVAELASTGRMTV